MDGTIGQNIMFTGTFAHGGAGAPNGRTASTGKNGWVQTQTAVDITQLF